MIGNIRPERKMALNDEQLRIIMYALTGWTLKPTTEDIVEMCNVSPPIWYAYMGLMETYLIKFYIDGKLGEL